MFEPTAGEAGDVNFQLKIQIRPRACALPRHCVGTMWIWRFLDMKVPPVIIHLKRIFHEKNHPAIKGLPKKMNTPLKGYLKSKNQLGHVRNPQPDFQSVRGVSGVRFGLAGQPSRTEGLRRYVPGRSSVSLIPKTSQFSVVGCCETRPFTISYLSKRP